MASLFHVTGPVHTFVRFRGASQFLYLGTAQISPEVDGDPAYLPVINSMKSVSKPMQKIYDGESHAVTALLNRFDFAVWRRCRDPQSHSATLADYGIDAATEIGSLVMGTGDFELAFTHGFFNTSAAGAADITQGRLYFSSVVGNYRELNTGTREHAVAVRFDCESARDAVTGEFKLYTESLSGYTFPAIT